MTVNKDTNECFYTYLANITDTLDIERPITEEISISYWKLLNTVLNKSMIPLIAPLLDKGLFITVYKEKAQIFKDYFIHLCATTDSGCSVQHDLQVVLSPLNDFVISDEKILSIIRSLSPNKGHGWDEMSVKIITLSDSALVLPITMIFTNRLKCGIFPKTWKFANVVPVHKKNEKNLKLLPYFPLTSIWEMS